METPTDSPPEAAKTGQHHLRFHAPHKHLATAFGDDWFGQKAEEFARFFGTTGFLVGQSVIVGIWIVINVIAITKTWHFDEYPFILLNLAFSLQAAYAAPLILLAQTRQADRDKAHSEADAAHREDLAKASMERQILAHQLTEQLVELMSQNTQLTQLTNELSKRIEMLTAEMHARVVQKPGEAPAAQPSEPGK